MEIEPIIADGRGKCPEETGRKVQLSEIVSGSAAGTEIFEHLDNGLNFLKTLRVGQGIIL